jgi:hypothetical protein
MHLEDLKNNAVVRGMLPDSLVTFVVINHPLYFSL